MKGYIKRMNIKNTNRRRFLTVSSLSVLGLSGLPFFSPQLALASSENVEAASGEHISSANEALQELMKGNLRYHQGHAIWPRQTLTRRKEVSLKQNPFAIIFSCVDSRVPPELVFDQGLGDLFTIRTAGHAIDRAVMGSMEFGVAELKIPLLVVMGHERCGAVSATMKAVDAHQKAAGDIQALVDYIRPAVLETHETGSTRLDHIIHNNTTLTMKNLMKSHIISTAVKEKKLTIVGARYDLDTGVVSTF